MPNPLYEIWGRNIRLRCKARDWTQADLAERLDVKQASVSRWMAGIAAPRDEQKLKIAELFEEPAFNIFPLVKVAS